MSLQPLRHSNETTVVTPQMNIVVTSLLHDSGSPDRSWKGKEKTCLWKWWANLAATSIIRV